MNRIMFVCHGNICRSPMAEFVFKKLIKERGLEDKFTVSSSATSTEEIWDGVGNPVYPPAKRELLKHGITCEGKRAVQLKKSDYENYDLFICMDSANVRNAIRILDGDKQGKVKKLLSFLGSDGDVADPWYSGNFEIAYQDIYRGCVALLGNFYNI
ncbi:MAG: low molecular weight phosphotyrosine protein phosphatase [Clostridiales bacterium]|nr:low molecular weight phosphotyrosine protein phosphatase [Clostridiales bacterium]